MIEIRKATLEDAAAIVPLWKQLMDQHHEIHRIFQLVKGSADGLLAAMQSMLANDKTAVFVASDKDRIIGFAMASLGRRPPQFILGLRGSISDIFVEEAYRKAGVATQLVAHSKQWLLSNGVEYIDMQVTVDNTAAMRFWEKQGFGTVNHYMVMNDTSITIRNAHVQDAAQIAYVHINTWKTTYTGIVPEAYLEQMELKARTEMW